MEKGNITYIHQCWLHTFQNPHHPSVLHFLSSLLSCHLGGPRFLPLSSLACCWRNRMYQEKYFCSCSILLSLEMLFHSCDLMYFILWWCIVLLDILDIEQMAKVNLCTITQWSIYRLDINLPWIFPKCVLTSNIDIAHHQSGL